MATRKKADDDPERTILVQLKESELIRLVLFAKHDDLTTHEAAARVMRTGMDAHGV